MIDDRAYLEQLDRALTQRGLDAARTAEVIGEIADHLAQSGERPQEAFGEPDQYAAALVAADSAEANPNTTTRHAPCELPPSTRSGSSPTSDARAGC